METSGTRSATARRGEGMAGVVERNIRALLAHREKKNKKEFRTASRM